MFKLESKKFPELYNNLKDKNKDKILTLKTRFKTF